jgi:hypothetical protein
MPTTGLLEKLEEKQKGVSKKKCVLLYVESRTLPKTNVVIFEFCAES